MTMLDRRTNVAPNIAWSATLRRDDNGQRSTERKIHGVASAHSGMMARSASDSGTKRSILPMAISRTATSPVAATAMTIHAIAIRSGRGRRAMAGANVRMTK